jgi:serine/threonine-protein kinase
MTDESVVGQKFAGKYRVEKILGKGGMGLVLGARHIKLDEPVAIKVLRPAMLEVPGMAARFLQEARAACKIKSLHVVRVTDVDTGEDGLPYMIMEYLDGVDLLRLRRRRTLGVAEAVDYVWEACEAIAEAHSLGIVHRDLKPANLFLHHQKDGRTAIKVLDFGISKVETPGEQEITKRGQMMGSPKYMSPEQMRSMGEVDGRSDIWSLGTILYELLTGQPPFVAQTTAQLCTLVLNADPALPSALRPEIPPALEAAVMRCLEKEPERRFATVAELREAISPFKPALRRAPESEATLASSPEYPTATPPPATRDAQTDQEIAALRGGSRRFAALLVGVAVLAAIVAFYLTQRGSDAVAGAARQQPAPVDTARSAEAPPPPAPPAEPAPKAYSLSDLPDVQPPASAAAPRPPAAPATGFPAAPSAFAKPSKRVSPSEDPFGGRRN